MSPIIPNNTVPNYHFEFLIITVKKGIGQLSHFNGNSAIS